MQSTTTVSDTRTKMNVTPTIQDQDQRTQALNPEHSFIVQAPAGSGKTELLTQRFLILLSTVKQPEEVLAITFTKKSAAEMRSRIIHSLKNAVTLPEPESAHQKTTWRLAKKVLQRDKSLSWFLLENPNRLRIQTIDSFNSFLTRQLPVLSHFGSSPEITDNPFELYRQAVQEFLSHLEENVEWSDAIATLLLHLDNDLNKVQSLLVSMLAKRDQWLPYITLNANDPMLRENLEANLASVFSDVLTSLQQNMPEQHIEELLYLARYAAHNVEAENPDSPIAYCMDLQSLPGTEYSDKNYWLGLQELLLTKSGDWRRKVDKNIGFPAPGSYKKPEEKSFATNVKNRLADLINNLTNHDDLLSAFLELKFAPDIFYQEEQWKTLEALHQVLRIVVAQLNVVFQQHGKIDYIENSQAALVALGTEDAPTDLTLALDYQIKHILIDEFQDTSNSQYRLLEKITAGWQTNDGRTLFLVGDPMQSIYRFREAEVGLFIRARNQGIGNIHLIPLSLSVNFRSVPGIVNWVNEKFPNVFPTFEDIASGAVSYSCSIACKPENNEAIAVKLNVCDDEDDFAQAEQIAQLILERKNIAPSETIAILVRGRAHLKNIIIALKKHKLSYRAIDIDPLTLRPFIQGLMALTRALLHPADRIAWLAVLRAPWCGLSLSDLLILSGNDPKISLLERLEKNDVLALCSHDGQQRLQRILPTLKLKLQERRRTSLRCWIESTWLLLGGPACLDNSNDLADAANYFNLLDDLDTGGDVNNLDLLSTRVEKLFAAPNNQADETLQIMTIHNSKGLEFDTVILPHLERKASNDDKQLLLWMERPRLDESSDLILAPVHAIGRDNDLIYDYIKRQQSEKNNYEKSRLLYVAVTRAKKQLHLFFNLKDNKKSTPNSLLEKLWPAIENEIPQIEIKTAALATNEHVATEMTINRIPINWQNPVHENRLAETFARHKKQQGFLLPNNHAKQTGTLIHQILQQICLQGVDWWQQQSSSDQEGYLKANLLNLGMLNAEISIAINTVQQAIANTLQDARGKWILQPHEFSAAEFPITAIIDDAPTPLVIDRTFVDENNVRWIIDYKSAQDTENDLEKFLDAQQKEYQEKMWHYYQAMRELDQREIRIGLYFPLMAAWREVVFA